jgi:hypothetical protein
MLNFNKLEEYSESLINKNLNIHLLEFHYLLFAKYNKGTMVNIKICKQNKIFVSI